MSKKSRISAIFLLVSIVCTLCLPISASNNEEYQFPHAYWSARSGFTTATENGNANDIIKYGELIIKCLENEPMQYVAGAKSTVYTAFIDIYQQREDYDKTADYLREYIKHAEYLGWDDAVKLSTAKLASFDLNLNVYAETKDTSAVPFYNQRVEPKNGIYAGRVFNYPNNNELPHRESEGIVSFYALFKSENFSDYDHMIRPFDDETRVIHLAWNLYEENSGLDGVISSNSDKHIIDTLKYINTLKSPTMLRIFAEMNVWHDLADAKKFKEAYIKIAKLARQYAPNTALVFSPNAISNWNVDISDYYPGDEYVDWVGVSLYTMKYSSVSNPVAREEYSEAYYFNGVYQNPIIMLKDIVERYGSKKPIIITEGAAGHTVKGINQDFTESSVKHVNQIYRYVSMLFPQVKAAIYFDVNVDDISPYNYTLAKNESVKNAYFNAIAKNPATNIKLTTSDTAYKPLDKFNEVTNKLNLSAYAVFPNEKQTTVEYNLDGKLHTAEKTIPYSASIDTTSLSTGSHSLKVTIKNGSYSKTFNYNITKSSDNKVSCTAITAFPTASSVLVNGKKVSFDAYNINGNNYFKLRDLAYVMNGTKKQFDVSWDSANNAIALASGNPYKAVGGEMAKGEGIAKASTPTSSKIYLNGKEVKFTAYMIDGNNYFKLRDIGKAFDFSVLWDEAKNTIAIDTGKSYTD